MESNIKKDNRKALPKYLLVLLIAALFGAALGFLIGFAGYHNLGETVADLLNRFLAAITPWGIPTTSFVILIAAWWKYLAAKKLCAAWDGEDEATVDTAEHQLNWVLLLTTSQMLLDFFFLAAAVVYWVPGRLTIVAEVAMFLISIAFLIVIQQRVVDLTRQLNPEKQGSIYDLKFKKKWMNSCDEAEQKQIGQAAFKAYNALNITCPVIWGVLVILSFLFDITLLPSFIVILIWGVLNGSYIIECIRMSQKSLP